MDKDKTPKNNEIQTDYVSARLLLKIIKPILAEELIAVYRFDREGLKLSFPNGQKFKLKIEESN